MEVERNENGAGFSFVRGAPDRGGARLVRPVASGASENVPGKGVGIPSLKGVPNLAEEIDSLCERGIECLGVGGKDVAPKQGIGLGEANHSVQSGAAQLGLNIGFGPDEVVQNECQNVGHVGDDGDMPVVGFGTHLGGEHGAIIQ